MTTTTDLLRKAAHLHEGVAKSAEHRGEPPAVVAGLRRDAASLLALADEMEPLQRDAERYRWLRLPGSNVPISPEAARDPEVYDAAIDAAMQEPKP